MRKTDGEMYHQKLVEILLQKQLKLQIKQLKTVNRAKKNK